MNAQFLKIIKNKTTDNTDFLHSELSNIIRISLKSYGYYKPIIQFFYQDCNLSKSSILIIKVKCGVPIYVNDIKIIITGDAKYDNDYLFLLKKADKIKGKILNHHLYEELKNSFMQLAIDKGYFDAKMKISKLFVSLKHNNSYWYFNFYSGKRYFFGPVEYSGSQISTTYLNNIIPFKTMEYYDINQLLKFNRLLVNTGWFDSVIVTPNLNLAHKYGIISLPINVLLTPRARNHVEIGGGYSNDVGFRIKTTWNKPWINYKGQSFFSNISISQFQQTIDANYKFFLERNPIEEYYIIQTGYKRTILKNIQSNTTTLNILKNWNNYKQWQYSINLRWSLSNFIQGKLTNSSMLLYPGINFRKTRKSIDKSIPSWGDSHRYSIEISSKKWASKISFFILQAENIWVKTIYQKHSFIIRNNLGFIYTKEFNSIPPDLRFFAGGYRTIRGYGYNQISPVDAEGKNIGASKLFIISLEYLYYINNHNLWSSFFIDAGEFTNNLNKINFKIGTGFGIRWSSPIGLIKLDIASPINNLNYNKKIRFHIGLGYEL